MKKRPELGGCHISHRPTLLTALSVCLQPLLGGAEESQSTWQGFSQKVRLLMPYMWPRNNILLQLLVLLCLGLLAIERVINVFVPIYYKNIGEVTPHACTVREHPSPVSSGCFSFLTLGLTSDSRCFLSSRPLSLPSVTELTDGSSWRRLASTVGIYVLLKFMQGGGAGERRYSDASPVILQFCASVAVLFCLISLRMFVLTSFLLSPLP